MKERPKEDKRWIAAIEAQTKKVGFVWGSADPLLGHVFQYLKEKIPSAFFCSIEGAGHYPQTEAPEIVAQKIREFVIG
jgi:pimeloyl-ACP methyl ester carboxylesterase